MQSRHLSLPLMMDRSLQHRRWDCLGPGSGSRGRMTEGRALPSETLLRSWRKWSLVQSVSLLHKHIIYQTWQCRPTRNTHVLQVHTHTHKLLHTSCTAAAEKEAEERIWVGKAMLSDCWWAICTLTCRLRSLCAVSFATAALTVS